MKKQLKKLLNILGIDIRKVVTKKEQTVVSLKTTAPSKGSVLLAYILDPFLLAAGEEISTGHTHHFESTLLAQSYLDLGYDVDVISYRDRGFIPEKDYVFYINARSYFTDLANRLNSDCIKIVHLDTAHFLFNNFAANKRSLDLQKRKSVTVISKKLFMANKAIEACDYATVLGNDFTIGTYSYAKKQIFPLPIPTPLLFDIPSGKNYDLCRKNFLWFGSDGLVHKGLDLALEAFCQLPDFSLTVCGPLEKESDFVEAYYEELYQTPNITAVGWVDVKGSEFKGIIANCVGLIYPSCAEGQAGAVITCMQAGLIPVVSYESGVDVNDYGVLLLDSSVQEIINAVTALSERSADELKDMSENAQAYCRVNHTGERYLQQNKKIINTILKLEAKTRKS